MLKTSKKRISNKLKSPNFLQHTGGGGFCGDQHFNFSKTWSQFPQRQDTGQGGGIQPPEQLQG